MPIICMFINCAALIWGGVVDYKRREIPNLVPILLLATGVASGVNVLHGSILMCAVALGLGLSNKLAENSFPGGDFKLLCALVFSSGLVIAAGTLCWTGLCAIIVGAIMKLPLRRYIPLCSYVAPAYILVCLTLFISTDFIF